MPAKEPLVHLVGVSTCKFTKQENLLLEAELFARICDELVEVFKAKFKDYFHIIKCNVEMENKMLERNFLSFVIKDILASGQYTLKGFAQYTDTHEDVIHEVISGVNANPSAMLLRRVIDLHRVVRSDLYDGIIKKITAQYLEMAMKEKGSTPIKGAL